MISAQVRTSYLPNEILWGYRFEHNCVSYDKDTAKYATKANQQLVATGQATQAKCPISGGPLNAEKTVEVGGVKVTFCCEKCQGKVAEAKGDAQAELVFSDAAFAKAFEVKKAAAK